MKFANVYQRIVELWPEQIVIDDGYPVDSANQATPGTTPNGGEKFQFPTLSKAWGEVEDQVDPITDDWGDMMVWTMFQEFHGEAKRLLKAGEHFLIPSTVSPDALEKRFRTNLNTEGWEDLREKYEK